MDAVTKRNDQYCRGCWHWRNLSSSSAHTNPPWPVCHYLLDTGHARQLDCQPGKGCIHYEVKEENEE